MYYVSPLDDLTARLAVSEALSHLETESNFQVDRVNPSRNAPSGRQAVAA